MIIKEKTQNVVTLPKRYVIAHCISVDCAMGAGVVVPIKNKFPLLKEFCKNYVSTTEHALGTVFRYENKDGIVYNLFSKELVSHRSGYLISNEEYLSNLKKCLVNLKKQMILNSDTILGIPKIGCGLDACDWNEVKALIENVFFDTEIKILVCCWDK